MKRICAVFLLFCLTLTCLTGCWDKNEMNEIGIVTGIAIDKNMQNNNYVLTIQVVLPANMQKKSGNQGKPFKDISAEGDTILKAKQNLSKVYERVPFFSHNRVIIVDETVAREGLMNALDLFSRSIESRDNMMLVIAKGTLARDVLDYENKTEQIPAIGLSNFKEVIAQNPCSIYRTLLDFNQNVYSYGMDPVLGVFSLVPKKNEEQSQSEEQKDELDYAGGAIFLYDRFQGFLNENETEAYNFTVGKVQGGIVNISGIQNKSELIATKILKASSKIVPHYDGTNISFDINISDTAAIGEVHDSTDITEINNITKLENEHQAKIKEEVESLINKVQTQYKSDIFGFGQTFDKKYPKQWEKIKDKWQTVFPTVKCNVTVKTSIVRDGMTDKRKKIQY